MSSASAELPEEGTRVFLKTIPDNAPSAFLRDIATALRIENARLELELASALARAQAAEGEVRRRIELELLQKFPQKARRRGR